MTIGFISVINQLDAQNSSITISLFHASTCFGRKRPSSGVFKTSTAAIGTCVIVAGKSSHLLIRAGRPAFLLPLPQMQPL